MDKNFLPLDRYDDHVVARGTPVILGNAVLSVFPVQVRKYEFVRKVVDCQAQNQKEELAQVSKYYLTYKKEQQSGITSPEMTIASTTYNERIPGDKYTTVDVNHLTTNSCFVGAFYHNIYFFLR